MSLEKKIIKYAEQILEEKKVKLVSNNDGFSYSDFGNISVRVDVAIDISHIDKFYDALNKLLDYNNDGSPIYDDGYTGCDIHYPYGSDVVYYIIEYSYVFEKYRDISISVLKENCDEKMVDDIIKKVDHLHSLGFENITLSYSSFMQKQFQERVDEEVNEITAGYYELEPEKILKIKYKILGLDNE